VGLKERTREALQNGSEAGIERLVSEEPGAVRHALGFTYHAEEGLRRRAARAVALASRRRPEMVQNIIRRLVWAMNDESGTNALTVPEVIQAVADERPELLLPMVPDLVRLSADPGLKEGLSSALRTISSRCRGEIGRRLSASLNERTGLNAVCHTDSVG
jgi:hypothetical protein